MVLLIDKFILQNSTLADFHMFIIIKDLNFRAGGTKFIIFFSQKINEFYYFVLDRSTNFTKFFS